MHQPSTSIQQTAVHGIMQGGNNLPMKKASAKVDFENAVILVRVYNYTLVGHILTS